MKHVPPMTLRWGGGERDPFLPPFLYPPIQAWLQAALSTVLDHAPTEWPLHSFLPLRDDDLLTWQGEALRKNNRALAEACEYLLGVPFGLFARILRLEEKTIVLLYPSKESRNQGTLPPDLAACDAVFSPQSSLS